MRVDARRAERQIRAIRGRRRPKASPPKICMSRKRTFGDLWSDYSAHDDLQRERALTWQQKERE
jgi:hypothetical protein